MYPTTVWDGTSDNRTIDQRKSPDYRDWNRMSDELIAAQTRVDTNFAIRSTGLSAVGTVTTKDGLTVVEKGDGAIHKTILTMTEMSLISTDGTTPLNDGAWGAQKLYTFPDGHINQLSYHIQFPLAGIAAVTGGGEGFADAANIEVGVGLAAAAQATQFDLEDADETVLGPLDIDLTSKTSNAIETKNHATPVVKDGHGGGVAYYLNFRTRADGDHGTSADVLLFTGVFTIIWSNLGDNG